MRNLFLGRSAFTDKTIGAWTVIRLIAAMAVIYGHSFGISPISGHQDITIRWIAHGITYSGQMAVVIFFFLSGALVTSSLRKSTPRAYAIKRCLRIFPGFFVCLLVTVLALRIVFQESKPKDLFLYMAINILNLSNLGQFPNLDNSRVWEIAGVFQENNYKAINGSLWTLPQEFKLYFYLFLLSCLFGEVTKRQLICVNFISLFYLVREPSLLPWIGSSNSLLGNNDAVINSIFFLLGSNVYLLSFDKIKSRYLLLASLSVYSYWFFLHRSSLLLFLLSICIGVIGIAKILSKINLRLPGDYSYGIYLYGWPTSQFTAFFYPHLFPEANCLITIALVFPIAVISWHLVERPAVVWAKKIGSNG